MSPQVRSPVQIQTAVAVPDGLHFNGSQGGSQMVGFAGRRVGQRRIFVQTADNGNVFGIEVDRADKVETVKKKIQNILCVPTEQSALVFGDHILENDLSEVRHDSPLLLTRGILRSSSLPCLSPTTSRDGFQKFRESRNFEIVGGQACSPSLKRLIRETVKAIDCGVVPHPALGGLGGAYYFRNLKGECAAIVKPTDEEPFAPNNPKGFVGKALGQPGLKRSIRVGETGVREVAAYLLDHERFANVPATALVKAAHSIFNINPDNLMVREGSSSATRVSKLCSYQQYVKHDFDASEHGTSRFPVSQVHRIGILDVRILNTDRHAGNILVRKVVREDQHGTGGAAAWGRSLTDDSVVLIPIDHGLCLPESLEDPYFEWLHWPQASIPFSDEELQYIAALDPFKDAELLRKELPMLRESAIRTLIICTTFLQRGAAAGLTLAEIGGMMSRELCGVSEEANELERVCMLAKLELEQALGVDGPVDEASSEEEEEEEEFVFDLDLLQKEEVVWGARDSEWRLPINGSHGLYTSGFSSPLSSPKVGDSRGIGLSPLLMLQEMHPLEEGADFPSSPYTPSALNRTSAEFRPPSAFEEKEKTLMSCSSFSDRAYSSRFLAPPRSVSLSSKNHRLQNRFEARRIIGTRGATSAFEETVCDATTPVMLSDINGKDWARFLDFVEDLLPAAFEKRKVESARIVQRLGTSCRF